MCLIVARNLYEPVLCTYIQIEKNLIISVKLIKQGSYIIVKFSFFRDLIVFNIKFTDVLVIHEHLQKKKKYFYTITHLVCKKMC